jgi:DNA mismatch endonuclease, patch repair protein
MVWSRDSAMKESPDERSRIMRAMKGRNTEPELIVYRLAHDVGYRFPLHRSDLPGKPDIVFAGCRKIIVVHGCSGTGMIVRADRAFPCRTATG